MTKLILAIQFVLELQWILRLAFSPMQLDFESAPFSHLGTSPKTRLLYQYEPEKSSFFMVGGLFFCQLQYRTHIIADTCIVFPAVRTQAVGAILDTIICISEIAAAPVTKAVQGAVTEKAAERFRICTHVTGKIFTFLILKKIIIGHIYSPSYFASTKMYAILLQKE